MAKIKIEDLTKGIKITEEELKQIRGGWSPQMPQPAGEPKAPAAEGGPEDRQPAKEKPDGPA
jgi:hypothetical protein